MRDDDPMDTPAGCLNALVLCVLAYLLVTIVQALA